MILPAGLMQRPVGGDQPTLALVLIYLRQSMVHASDNKSLLGCGGWIAFVVLFFDLIEWHRHTVVCFAKVVNQQVVRDAIEPRAKRQPYRTVIRQSGQHAHKDIARQVFRYLPIIKTQPQVSKDALVVLVV